MEKYKLIPEQLIYEGTIREDNLFLPGELDEETILRTHLESYWYKLKHQTLSPKEIRKTGFPLSAQLIERECQITRGTIEAACFALEHGVSMNIAGGTHHAFTDRGEGFCLLNDFAVAAHYLLHHQLAKKIMIVDLDVHQGNGTAEIFRNDPAVFTFSMHCEANYPMHKERSDLDISLPPYIEDKPYLKILEDNLPGLIDKVQPDFIFYLSGVDILKTDKLGHMNCTIQGCRQRDAFVLDLCHRHNIPVAISMGGGYSPMIRDIVEAHCNTYRLAAGIWF